MEMFMDKYCFLQVSDRLLNPDDEDNPADNYNKALWPNMAKHGYFKPHHYWEIPTWIAQMSHALGNFGTQRLHHITRFDNEEKLPDAEIYFASVLDCNKYILRDLVYDNPHHRFVFGGYIGSEEVDRLFGHFHNIKWYESIEDFVHIEYNHNLNYRFGTDYGLFNGMLCIPRLALSEGCSHGCKFCSIDNTVVQYSGSQILQQAESFRDLHFELVYINDKTFGQASNCIDLKYLYNTIKAYNPDFRGFIVQTSCAQIFKWINSGIDLSDLHIVNMEIGVESYNNDILMKYNKPQTTLMIDTACKWVQSQGMNVIPNLIIGLPGETIYTYSETLQWLHNNKDMFLMLNVTTFVPYYGSDAENIVKVTKADLNQNICERSWHSDKEAAAVFTYTAMLFEIGMQIIRRPV
jgi:hypothetical protein